MEEKLGFETASDLVFFEDLNRAKKEIMINNYLSIIEKLINYYETIAIAKGVVYTEEDIFSEAHDAFCEAKNNNTIDELNILITPII